MLVGEQPGDREDIAGRPFVGPAGKLLDECLHEAGVDRSLCYVTNAVKHFKPGESGASTPSRQPARCNDTPGGSAASLTFCGPI